MSSTEFLISLIKSTEKQNKNVGAERKQHQHIYLRVYSYRIIIKLNMISQLNYLLKKSVNLKSTDQKTNKTSSVFKWFQTIKINAKMYSGSCLLFCFVLSIG